MQTRMNSGAILTPEEVGPLLVEPTINQCQASRVATTYRTAASSFRIPAITADPSAGWVEEGEEIPITNMAFAEIDVQFGKLAALTDVTAESAADTNPTATQLTGQGMARNLALRLDQAFFGNVPAPSPAGLESLDGVNVIDASSGISNLDAFAQALSYAATMGATVDTFVASPADALTLQMLKQYGQAGSNMPLLGVDPTQPTQSTIFGVLLVISAGVQPGHMWAIPQDRAALVVRQDASIESDNSVFFTSDRVAVRARMRVGFGFAQPAALTKILTPASKAPAKAGN